MTASKKSTGDLLAAEWLQATPGERFKIRTSVKETEGAIRCLSWRMAAGNNVQKNSQC
jgi:hypothetical protein